VAVRAAPNVIAMGTIDLVSIEAADTAAATRFYDAAFDVEMPLRLRDAAAPTTGFRGFTLSLVASQPATVDGLIEAAIGAGATSLKPAAKSLWGYGGVVQAPDGTIWTVASSAKKDTGPGRVEEIVLQLGVEDVAASRQFYVDRGFIVAKSYGRKYVQFDTGRVRLALYKRRGLAKVAGVAADGTGSHRLAVAGEAGPFTDPDGFVWEAA
jgi:predicted lactoylglutathione lyase